MNKFNSIFLCAPYTFTIDSKTNLINETYKAWLQKIIDYLQQKVDILYNSHTREEWGVKLSSPKEAVSIDFAEIRIADCIIAYIGNPRSIGVSVELGFAAAHKKPIFILNEKDDEVPYFVQGLEAYTNVKLINFEDLNDLFIKLDKEF